MKFVGVLLTVEKNIITVYKEGEKYYEISDSAGVKVRKILQDPQRYNCEFEATPKTKVVFDVVQLSPSTVTISTIHEEMSKPTGDGHKPEALPQVEIPPLPVKEPMAEIPLNNIEVKQRRKIPAYEGKKCVVSIGAKINVSGSRETGWESLHVQVDGDDATFTLNHLNGILDTIGRGSETRLRIETYQEKVLRPRAVD